MMAYFKCELYNLVLLRVCMLLVFNTRAYAHMDMNEDMNEDPR